MTNKEKAMSRGWNGANEIFKPMARTLIAHTLKGTVKPEVAEEILRLLIEELRAGGWSDEQMNLMAAAFADFEIVTNAFKAFGILVKDANRREPMFKDIDIAINLVSGMVQLLGDGGVLLVKMPAPRFQTLISDGQEFLDMLVPQPLKVVG